MITDNTQALYNALERIKQLEERLTWKSIDDYARSGAYILLVYKDCSSISYEVARFDDDEEFYTDRDYIVFYQNVLGYMPIPKYEEK